MPRFASKSSIASKCASSSRASAARGAWKEARSGYWNSKVSAALAAFFSQCAWSSRISSR